VCKKCGHEKLGPDCGINGELKPEDKQKLEWVMRCVDSDYPNSDDVALNGRVHRALKWHSRTTPSERTEFRENMVRKLQRVDAEQRSSGMLEAWNHNADAEIREVIHVLSMYCHFPFIV